MTASHRVLLAAATTAAALLLGGCQPADSTHRSNPTPTASPSPAGVIDTTVPDDPTPTVETSSPVAPPPAPPTTAAAAPAVPAAPAAPDTPADDHPAGATALCNDGTYSYSAHHQGTCSHHQGVAE